MTPHDPLPALRARARRAYELGRLRSAAWAAMPALALVVVAALANAAGGIGPVLAIGAVLVVACAVLVYVGRGLQREVTPGLIAGAVPVIVAMTTWRRHGCRGDCSELCAVACAGAGLIVGAWLGARMAPRASVGVAAASLGIAVLAAATGCLPIGAGTLVGAVVGLALGLVPLWGLRRATAR